MMTITAQTNRRMNKYISRGGLNALIVNQKISGGGWFCMYEFGGVVAVLVSFCKDRKNKQGRKITMLH